MVHSCDIRTPASAVFDVISCGSRCKDVVDEWVDDVDCLTQDWWESLLVEKRYRLGIYDEDEAALIPGNLPALQARSSQRTLAWETFIP